MSDLHLDAELDRFGDEQEQVVADALAVSEDELTVLAQREGPWKELAQELLVVRRERAAKAEATVAAALAAEAVESGADLSDPDIQAGLRAQVQIERAAQANAYLRWRESELRHK